MLRLHLRCVWGDAKGKTFYQHVAIDEYSGFRYSEAFGEHSAYFSAVFLKSLIKNSRFKYPTFKIPILKQLDNRLPVGVEKAFENVRDAWNGVQYPLPGSPKRKNNMPVKGQQKKFIGKMQKMTCIFRGNKV